MGHISFVYLDDGSGSQPDNCSAQAASTIQRKDLDSSGPASLLRISSCLMEELKVLVFEH